MSSMKIQQRFTSPPAEFSVSENVVSSKGAPHLSLKKSGPLYFLLYGILATLLAVCTWVFFQTFDPRIPKWQIDESLIGTNPVLSFRPMPENNEESTLIWLQSSNQTSYRYWVNNIMQFLDKYYLPGKNGWRNIMSCSYDNYPSNEKVCEVDIRAWRQCNKEQYFNYHRNSPCIFLKLNKMYGWIPEYYDDPYDLPDEMPESLKNYIRNINNPNERQTVWVSCEGENPADVEFMGPISYNPTRGFPGYYFPYLGSEGYLSPLVVVSFERPASGVVINVECRAWAKNIIYNRAQGIGLVHFKLLID